MHAKYRGLFALGLLMAYLLDVWPPRRLLRPFLAIGLIGGYTTFSTYAAGVATLIRQHALARADAYALRRSCSCWSAA